jgi:protein SCO1/2
VLATAALLIWMPDSQETRPSGVGGPFTLVSQDGRTVTERDFQGAPFLVFFGFTHCPDICPTKLFEISEVLRALGERGRAVRALFITVDSERDTPAAMKDYLVSFDPRVVGLTGDRPAVDAAVHAYRAYARKVPLQGDDYTMEHTSLVYLMDKKGRFVGAFNLDRPPEQAAQELLRYL